MYYPWFFRIEFLASPGFNGGRRIHLITLGILAASHNFQPLSIRTGLLIGEFASTTKLSFHTDHGISAKGDYKTEFMQHNTRSTLCLTGLSLQYFPE